MSQERLIDYERLTTPKGHLETLLEPSIEKLLEVAGVRSSTIGGDQDQDRLFNHPSLCRHGAGITGRDASARLAGPRRIAGYDLVEIRESLRRRLGLRGLVVLTGHQCEFFHAGVLAKTIATVDLAERVGGESAFMGVDSDLTNSPTVVVPCVDDGEVRVESFPIPGCEARRAIEDQPLVAVARWRAFFEGIRRRYGARASMLEEYARGLEGDADMADVGLGEVVFRGQRNVLESLGLTAPTVISVSRATDTPEFRLFAAHLAVCAEEFARCYNEARRSYRRRRRVRNPQRPAPLLSIDGGRVEAPLWLCRPGEPRRRVFVERSDDRIVLYAEDERAGVVEASPARGLDDSIVPLVFEDAQWRVRPRALALTAFARLFLCDVFVHGIGGAKYDEMTEDFARSFFGVDLTPACCVSATARLPLPRDDVVRDDVLRAERALRDIRYNPQRHIDGLPRTMLARRDELIRRSGELRAAATADRREVFEQIRAANAEMLRRRPERPAELRRRLDETTRRHRSNVRACEREFFFALHSRETLTLLARNIRGLILGNRATRGED